MREARDGIVNVDTRQAEIVYRHQHHIVGAGYVIVWQPNDEMLLLRRYAVRSRRVTHNQRLRRQRCAAVRSKDMSFITTNGEEMAR